MLQINTQLLLPPHIPMAAIKPRKARENKPNAKFNAGDHVVATFKSGATIKAEIVAQVAGSRTLFIVRDIDRGAGWDERAGKYVGVFYPHYVTPSGEIVSGGWGRGENHGFGLEYKMHINQLTK